MKKRASRIRTRIAFGKNIVTTRTRRIYRRTTIFVNRRPFTSFFIVFGVLLFLIFVSAFLHRQKPTTTQEAPLVRSVREYHIGSTPKVRVQAQIEKSGVITITALTPGVVQQISVKEGDVVAKGKTLLSLSTNYQGGNALSTQRAIADKQLQNAEDTYNDQIDLINNQKRQAELLQTQAADLRNITNASISDTQSLIDVNNDILDTINKNLEQLTTNNPGGVNDQTILSMKELKSQFSSANNQLHQSLLNAQYQVGSTNAPAQLSQLQRDITVKQLDIQAKTITLNRDLSRLQDQLARINEAQMFPSAPFGATVQRVFVREGQAVNPGTPLVLLSQDAQADPIVAVAYVSKQIADQVSTMQDATLSYDGGSYDTAPSFVSTEAVQGTLYAIFFPIPDTLSSRLTDKDNIFADLPLGNPDTTASIPFVPIDAVYQTDQNSFIFIDEAGTVVARNVTLGNVYGSFVEVENGVHDGDAIILDRTVVAGDKVQGGS